MSQRPFLTRVPPLTGSGDEERRERLLAAQAAALERLLGRIRRACAGEREWPFRVHAGIGAVVRFAAEEPDRARLLCFEGLVADPPLARAALDSRTRLAELLRPGRPEAWLAAGMPSVTERALVDAVAALIAPSVLRCDAARLLRMEPRLAQLVLLPYVGTEAAARIAGSQRSFAA